VTRQTRLRPLPFQAAALLCAGSLWADMATARTPRPPRAPSTPSTAQILAPSAATVPDTLPPDTAIYRCGNAYSARACGDARPLDLQDSRTDAQRRQSRELTSRDQRLAAWLEAQRHGREAAASAPQHADRAPASAVCVDKPGKPCRPRPQARRVVTRPASGPSMSDRR
jgi:hypothetical protein